MVWIRYKKTQLSLVPRAQRMWEHHISTYTTIRSALNADFTPSSKPEVAMLIITEYLMNFWSYQYLCVMICIALGASYPYVDACLRTL